VNPDQLTEAVRDLHERAFDLRITSATFARMHNGLPVSVKHNMRAAAQLLDDAARDLLVEYGEPMPDGAL